MSKTGLRASKIVFKGDLEIDLEGDSERTSNRTWKGTCCQAQVRSSPSQGQVKSGDWFRSTDLDHHLSGEGQSSIILIAF